MARPNIFSFATSELSQDAFVCWLLSWADPQYAADDEALHKTATRFLDSLFQCASCVRPDVYKKVEVTKQFKHIDILVRINEHIPLIIEDKTGTKDHSDQLARYRTLIEQEYKTVAFPAIYLKTGDQSGYANIEKAGYGVFRRSHFLELLEYGRVQGVSDRIFCDFQDYLLNIENAVKAYQTKPLDAWDGNCWTGFFIELQQFLTDGNWDYVPNPSGGFMGFWWYWHQETKTYLQLEERKLCFKIEVEDKSQYVVQRDYWHHEVMKVAANNPLGITRPSRLAQGTWMTVAVIDDFRRSDSNGRLDFTATLELLKQAQRVLDTARSQSLITVTL